MGVCSSRCRRAACGVRVRTGACRRAAHGVGVRSAGCRRAARGVGVRSRARGRRRDGVRVFRDDGVRRSSGGTGGVLRPGGEEELILYLHPRAAEHGAGVGGVHADVDRAHRIEEAAQRLRVQRVLHGGSMFCMVVSPLVMAVLSAVVLVVAVLIVPVSVVFFDVASAISDWALFTASMVCWLLATVVSLALMTSALMESYLLLSSLIFVMAETIADLTSRP